MARQNSDPPKHKPEKTLVFVTTDGLENASKKFSADAIRSLIANAEENSKWEFVFFGANFDVVETARTYGIKEDNAVSFSACHEGIGDVYREKRIRLKEFLN